MFPGHRFAYHHSGETLGKSPGRKLRTGQAAWDVPKVPVRTCDGGAPCRESSSLSVVDYCMLWVRSF